jgi:hypothetical protein
VSRFGKDPKSFLPLALALLLTPAPPAAADNRSVIGYTALAARPAALQADGAGVPVAQVEVSPTGTAEYTPDTTDPQFAGKSFTYRSGAPSVSSHATQVAAYFYGNAASPAPGVSTITLFSANGFIDGLLRAGRRARAPGGAGAMVINNSWIAAYADDAANVDAVRRLDDLINRDDLLAFNAVSNTATDPFPRLMATSYNGVSVGILTGGSQGPVTFDSAGPRIKPDLVVDAGITSNATALASGAAALLRSEAIARQLPAGELATKALLLAGAHRNADWHRGRTTGKDNATAPLDFQQGAGQLRVDHAFDILTAGQQPAATSIDPSAGWDYARTPRRATSQTYYLHVDQSLPQWAAFLTWNRLIAGPQSDGSYSTAPTLADMDLSLYLSKRGGRRPVARSDSPDDNVESLTLTDLAPGDYQLELTTDLRSYYALAWYADPDVGAGTSLVRRSATSPEPSPLQFGASSFLATEAPEPSSCALITVAMTALVLRPRRRDRIGHRRCGCPQRSRTLSPDQGTCSPRQSRET